MSEKMRLDALLVKKGLEESRERAKALIMQGIVYVDDQKADKPGMSYSEDSLVEIRGKKLAYVSRGGLKLEKAMQQFPIELGGKSQWTSGPPPGALPTVCCKTARRRSMRLMWVMDSSPGSSGVMSV